MLASSRIRRQKEFLEFLLRKFQPCCYFCGEEIDPGSFNVRSNERDPLTIHHVDEDREHNEIENLVLIHRWCHQQLHKLADGIGIPAEAARELVVKKRKERLSMEEAKDRIKKEAS